MGRRKTKSNSQSKQTETEKDSANDQTAEESVTNGECQHLSASVCGPSELANLNPLFIDTCSQCALQLDKRLNHRARNCRTRTSTNCESETKVSVSESEAAAQSGENSPTSTTHGNETGGNATDASNVSAVYLCVTCLQRNCEAKKHALQHYNNTRHNHNHPVAIDPRTFELFCFACDRFVDVPATDTAVQRFINTLTDRLSTPAHGSASASAEPAIEIKQDVKTAEEGEQQPENQSECNASASAVSESEKTTTFDAFEIEEPRPVRTKPSAPSNRKTNKANAKSVSNSSVASTKPSTTASTASSKASKGKVDSDEESNATSISGLANLGNTCFFNSTLQSLVRTPCLRDLLSSYLETDFVRAVSPTQDTDGRSGQQKQATLSIGGRSEQFEGDFADVDELDTVVRSLAALRIDGSPAPKKPNELVPVTVHFTTEDCTDTTQIDDATFDRVTKMRKRTRVEIGEQLVIALTSLDGSATLGGPRRKASYNPSGLFSKLADRVPRFRTYQQQDAHELLCYLLDSLRTEFVNQLRAFLLLHLNVDTAAVQSPKAAGNDADKPADAATFTESDSQSVPKAAKNKRQSGAKRRNAQNGHLDDAGPEAEGENVDRAMLRRYGTLMRNASPIDVLFGGTTVTFVRCRSCALPFRPRFEHFLNVSLPITRFDEQEHKKPSVTPKQKVHDKSAKAAESAHCSEPTSTETRASVKSAEPETMSKHQLKKLQETNARAAKRERKREAQRASNRANDTEQSPGDEPLTEELADEPSRDLEAPNAENQSQIDVAAEVQPQQCSDDQHASNCETTSSKLPDTASVLSALTQAPTVTNEPSGMMVTTSLTPNDCSVSAAPTEETDKESVKAGEGDESTGSDSRAVRDCSQVDSAVGSSESLDADRSAPQSSSSSSYTHVEEVDERNRAHDASSSPKAGVCGDLRIGSSESEDMKPSAEVSKNGGTVYSAVFAASQRCAAAPARSGRRSGVVESLEEAFEQFVRTETMSGSNQVECPHCTRAARSGSAQPANADSASSDVDADVETKQPLPKTKKQKQTSTAPQRGIKCDADLHSLIYELPAVLVVHFKRFAQHGTTLRKIDDHVRFGVSLDLAPFCSRFTPYTLSTDGHRPNKGQVGDGLDSNMKRNKAAYRLFAVVQHEGSMRSGHYIAYVCVRRNTQPSSALLKLQNRMQKRLNGLSPSSLDGLVNTYLEHFSHNEAEHSLNTFATTEEVPNNCEEMQERNVKTDGPSEGDASAENWFYCSDTHVRRCGLAEVLRAEAYLLFYESVGLFGDY